VDKKRIAIIEDHPIMLYGLTSYFEKTGRWRVTGTASTLSQAKSLLQGLMADIILLDIQLEDGWSLDIVPWFQAAQQAAAQQAAAQQAAVQSSNPSRPILAIYSNYDDYAHVNAALGMGVRAYISKRRDEKELEKALIAALNGSIYIDNTARVKLQTVKELSSLLTKRETEILCHVKNGFSNKQIAACLNISPRTVENILSGVYDKTGIKTRLELQNL